MFRFFLLIFLCFPEIVYYAQESFNISHESGYYDSSIILTINSDYDKLYYEDNGAVPNKKSKLWEDSLIINKHSILRITPVIDGEIQDTVINRFYLIDFQKKLPVIGIAIDPEDLWSDKKGIYIRGSRAYKDTNGVYKNCNYYKNWEKEVYFMYLESDNVILEQECGMKIFGETTRSYSEKSFKIIAREKYGKKIFKHDFFDTKNNRKHKHLVIRTSGNDYRQSRFKDVLSAYLVRNLDIDYMAYQPVHLFVNAEYWGLYNLREKINEHFLRYNHKVDPDSVSIIKGKWITQHGSREDYMKMYSLFKQIKEMDSVAYKQINEFLDVRNYINFRIFQLYINNLDSRGNIRYWNSSQGDGKFRMMLYDTDHGYGSYSRPFLKNSLSKSRTFWYNPTWSTMYLRKLMSNLSFKKDFLVQYAHLLNTSLHTDTIIEAVSFFENIYKDELPRPGEEIAKHLKKIPLTESQWQREVNLIKKFAKQRDKHVKKQLVSLLATNGWFLLNIKGNSGLISINGNYPLGLPFQGEYLKGFSFEIKALDEGYYKFISWSDGDSNRIKLVDASVDQVFDPIYEYIEPFIVETEIDNDEIISKISEPLIFSKEDILLWIGYLLLSIGFIFIGYVFLYRKLKKAHR